MERSETAVNNKQARIRLYLRGKEMAQRLIRVADRVLAGETETTACMEENVDVNWMRRFVRGDISIDRSLKTGKDRVEITQDDWMCWQDRFLTRLTGEERYAPKDFDQIYEVCVAKACTEQEQEVLRLRMQEELTLREISRRIGKSQERVRQIESQAMRKLRHPSRRLPLMYGKDYLERMETVTTAQAEYDKARLARMHKVREERKAAVLKLQKKQEHLQEEINAMGSIDDSQVSDIINEIPISEMGLSVRARNALSRHRVQEKANISCLDPIETVGQLSRLSHKELCSIRNIGVNTVKEIEEALFKQYGIRII